MVITHLAVALLFALPVVVLAPELAVPALVGALAGGIFPDIDLFVGVHRRTFHFPVLAPALAVPAVVVALVAPSPLAVGGAVFLLGGGSHSASDVLGAGLELRPWERTNPDAVYDHVSGRWWKARYVIPYDGSPRDLTVSLAAGAPLLFVYDGPVQLLVAVLLVGGGLYTLLRRRLVPFFERLG